MTTRKERRVQALTRHREDVASTEEHNPGFWERNPLRIVRRVGGGYQWGWEIQGHGTAMGYCGIHRHTHKTKPRTARCIDRFLRGIPSWQVWRGWNETPRTKEGI